MAQTNELLDTRYSTLEVIFDNGGSVFVQTETYCHFYQDGKQAAEDVSAILSGDDPNDSENEPENRLEYTLLTYDQQRLYTHYNLADLQKAMDSKEPIKTPGFSEAAFLRELTGRKHI